MAIIALQPEKRANGIVRNKYWVLQKGRGVGGGGGVDVDFGLLYRLLLVCSSGFKISGCMSQT